MLPNQEHFFKEFSKLDVKNVIVVCIGRGEYHTFLIGQNKGELVAMFPWLKLMVTDIDSAEVKAYGKDMNNLGLNLINQFKAQDMEIMQTYDCMDQYIDTETYAYEDDWNDDWGQE